MVPNEFQPVRRKTGVSEEYLAAKWLSIAERFRRLIAYTTMTEIRIDDVDRPFSERWPIDALLGVTSE